MQKRPIMRYLFLLLFSLISALIIAQQDKAAGYWYGQLEIMGTQHELLFEVVNQTNANGKLLKGKYDLFLLNPDDSTRMSIDIDKIEISKKHFNFEIKALRIKYVANTTKNFELAKGIFTQHGINAPLKLVRNRSAFKKTTKRPQTPKPTFRYFYKEIKIKHIKEDFELSGTLVLPVDTTSNYPIVIMVSGSGPQDRDNTIFDHKSFAVIADYLAKNGIASFRFDDRGTGKSGGNFKDASLTGLAQDAESVFAFLKSHGVYGSHKIGILGHSEGAMHAWMVTKKRQDVDFIISLAGPARLGRDIVQTQQQDIVFKATNDRKKSAFNGALFMGILDILEKSEDEVFVDKLMREFITAMHENAPKSVQDDFPLESLVQALPPIFNNAWGRELILWNPADYVPNYDKPVLYLIGSEDLQVKAKTNLESFKKLQHKLSELQSTVELLPGLNHLLQKCNECTVQEYGLLEETISEEVLEMISEFLKDL